MADFKTRIKELRSKNNLTQSEFGALFDQSKGVIAQWEAGNNYPRLDTLIKICDHFNISADILLRGKDHLTKTPSESDDQEGVKRAESNSEDIISLLHEIKDGQKAIVSSLKTILLPDQSKKGKRQGESQLPSVAEQASELQRKIDAGLIEKKNKSLKKETK